MSERLHSAEHQPTPEVSHIEKDLLDEKRREAEKSEKLDIDTARQAIEKAAPVSKETAGKIAETEQPNQASANWWSEEISSHTLDRILTTTRRKLSAPEKRLSKFVHQPAVEKLSDFGGKTVARPSGILFGGIFSFIFSLGAYLLARHLGGQLRYSVFAVTFVAGYLLGLVFELVWRLIARKRA